MCLDERNTERRGRLLPARRRLRRTRCRRRKNRTLAFSVIDLFLLAFLATDGLGRILDALALVWFRWTVGADLRRDLTDALTIGAAHGDQGRPFARDLDIPGDWVGNLVTIAKLQIERVALHGGAVADAIDFKRDRKPSRNAGDHVVHQRACRA